MRGYCRRLARIAFWGAALVCSALPAAAVEDVPISLISYGGERPVVLPASDPLAGSVGVLFIPPEDYANLAPWALGYATAFLVSECYALTGMAGAPFGKTGFNVLPLSMRGTGGSVIEPVGLRFGLGVKQGSDPANLTEASFRTSWPVTIHRVVPYEILSDQFELTHWWLLHLEGCETGAKGNGKPITFDPVTTIELLEAGTPAAARHVGALLTEDLALMELPRCQILGVFRSKQWESTCSSWLGMVGGPVMTYDQNRKSWTTIGFIPQPNIGLLLTPTESLKSGKRAIDIYKVDARNPRYFNYTTHVVPMAQVWPWIRDQVESDNPGLIDPKRADIAESKINVKQLLLMQMQQRPESSWSAFDYTKFGLGLEVYGQNEKASALYKAAIGVDPDYAPAAFELSQMLGSMGPRALSEAQLRAILRVMGDAVDKYPEDPQLILHRISVERRLALYKEMLADAEKYQSTGFRYSGMSPLHVDRGDAFLAIGDVANAKAAYAEAYRIDAMNGDAIRGLAKTKLYDGDQAGALRLAQRAVLIEPASSASRIILSIARATGGDIDGAIAVFEEGCDACFPTATPHVFLAILRGYKRALDGDPPGTLLIAERELENTYTHLWPREVADVFAGTRTFENLAGFDYSDYDPEWRRSIGIGNLVFAAAYHLSQARTIDYPALEQQMLKYRDVHVALLAPILKDWSDRVAASKQ